MNMTRNRLSSAEITPQITSVIEGIIIGAPCALPASICYLLLHPFQNVRLSSITHIHMDVNESKHNTYV